MKRLAVLILTSAVVWSGGHLPAADPQPVPLLSGIVAPTTPQVPIPVLVNGDVVATTDPAASRLREILGSGPLLVPGPVDSPTVGPRRFGQRLGIFRFRLRGTSDQASALTGGPMRWCEDCAPAVRHPLPPLPPGVINAAGDTRVKQGRLWQVGYNTPSTPATPAVSCPSGGCGGGHDGSCWSRFKAFMCYHPSRIHLGLTPTPRITPFYMYFPCYDNVGYGPGGCATGKCATGKCATGGPPTAGCATGACAPTRFGISRPIVGLPPRGVAGSCQTCPQPAGPVMPGYRMAAPETPGVAGQNTTTPIDTSSVVTSGYRTVIPFTPPQWDQNPTSVTPVTQPLPKP